MITFRITLVGTVASFCFNYLRVLISLSPSLNLPQGIEILLRRIEVLWGNFSSIFQGSLLKKTSTLFFSFKAVFYWKKYFMWQNFTHNFVIFFSIANFQDCIKTLWKQFIFREISKAFPVLCEFCFKTSWKCSSRLMLCETLLFTQSFHLWKRSREIKETIKSRH